MSEINIVHISKLNAAKRQLEYAIEIFLKSGDIVVTHTVIAASHLILSDLGKKQGIKSSVINLDLIKKDKQKKFLKASRDAQNFFKHADKKNDEKKVLEFNPMQSEFLILDACMFYRALTNKITPRIVLFESWMRSKYSHWFKDNGNKPGLKKLTRSIHYSQKEKFLELLPDLEIAFRINN